jgi:hypothetical protein
MECRHCREPIEDWRQKKVVQDHMRSIKHRKARRAFIKRNKTAAQGAVISAIAAAQASVGLVPVIATTVGDGGVIEHTSAYSTATTTIAAGDIVADFDAAGGIGVVDGGDVVGEDMVITNDNNADDDDDLSDLDDEDGESYVNETLIDPQSGEFTRPSGKRRSKARVTLRARLQGKHLPSPGS